MSHISCVRILTSSQNPTKREYILETREKEQERKRGINFAPSGRGHANTTEYDFFSRKIEKKRRVHQLIYMWNRILPEVTKQYTPIKQWINDDQGNENTPQKKTIPNQGLS